MSHHVERPILVIMGKLQASFAVKCRPTFYKVHKWWLLIGEGKLYFFSNQITWTQGKLVTLLLYYIHLSLRNNMPSFAFATPFSLLFFFGGGSFSWPCYANLSCPIILLPIIFSYFKCPNLFRRFLSILIFISEFRIQNSELVCKI